MLIEVSLKTFKYEVSIWFDQEVEVVAACFTKYSITPTIIATTAKAAAGIPKTVIYHGRVIAWVSPHKAKT